MDQNNIQDIKYNKKKKRWQRNVQRMLDSLKKNSRYIGAGVILVAILLIVALGMDGKDQPASGFIIGGDSNVDGLQEDAEPTVSELITNYYTAYANGDVATITTLATPVSEREQGYISLFSQYVDAYQNLKFYTLEGTERGSYLVSVYVDVKFTGVDTLAPGLDFFYVRTNEEGALYIDNLYSQYNLKNKDNALDTEVYTLIQEFQQREDVIALLTDAQAKFDAALVADANLTTVLQVTIPEAISNWMTELVAANPEMLPETPSTEVPVTETPETEVPVTETPETEVPVESETPEVITFEEGTVITIKETLNVRKGMNTSTDRVGVVYQGEKVTVIMSYAEGWTKIQFNGDETGYIRSDLLQ